MAKKRFCFRFDVDTAACIEVGVPALLALAEKRQVPTSPLPKKLSTAVFVRLTAAERDEIRRLAENESRTISGQTRHLIRQGLERVS